MQTIGRSCRLYSVRVSEKRPINRPSGLRNTVGPFLRRIGVCDSGVRGLGSFSFVV